VLSLIEHKETSHERPMGLVFERVIHTYTQALADQDACRMLAFDFHRFPSSPLLACVLLPCTLAFLSRRCRHGVGADREMTVGGGDTDVTLLRCFGGGDLPR